MTLEQADEMLQAAKDHGTLMPVNLIIRYNPITDVVKAVIESGLLGRPLRAEMTNCATDEILPPDHWFWDKQVSGGIFIEHGVHFFDLYRYWLGPGRVVSAHAEVRGGTAQEDRVTCTIVHDNTAIVTHYHGFDQPERLDRTRHRLIFETGQVAVEGWIPLRCRVLALVDDPAQAQLEELCAPLTPQVRVLETYHGDGQWFIGRGVRRRVTQKVQLEGTAGMSKDDLYAWSIRQLMTDQIAALAGPARPRRITEANGRQSLALAVDAAERAGHATHWHRPSA